MLLLARRIGCYACFLLLVHFSDGSLVDIVVLDYHLVGPAAAAPTFVPMKGFVTIATLKKNWSFKSLCTFIHCRYIRIVRERVRPKCHIILRPFRNKRKKNDDTKYGS